MRKKKKRSTRGQCTSPPWVLGARVKGWGRGGGKKKKAEGSFIFFRWKGIMDNPLVYENFDRDRKKKSRKCQGALLADGMPALCRRGRKPAIKYWDNYWNSGGVKSWGELGRDKIGKKKGLRSAQEEARGGSIPP